MTDVILQQQMMLSTAPFQCAFKTVTLLIDITCFKHWLYRGGVLE